MQTKKENNVNKNALSYRLLGAPTPAKASGLSFSLATLFPSILMVVVLAICAAVGLLADKKYAERDWYRYIAYLLPQTAFALVAIFYLRYRQIPLTQAIRRQKCHPKYFLWALLLQVGLLSLTELNSLFLLFLERFGYQPTPIVLPSTNGWGLVGVLVVVALLPAITEEVFFRGILLDGVKSFGFVKAVLLSGALFALFHQNPPQTVYQFCCGAAFALVALRSGSVLPSMLSHLCNNAFIIVLYALQIESIPTPVYLPYIILSAVCLAVSLVYFIWMDKSKPDGEEQGEEKKEKVKNERKSFFMFACAGIALCLLTWVSALFA